MIPITRACLVASFAIAAGMGLAGCGKGKASLDQLDTRLQAVAAKGAPDSLVASAKVYLFQAKGAKQINDGFTSQKYTDSAVATIEKAESWCLSTTTSLKPAVDSLRNSLLTRKKQLSGLQLHVADSLMAIIDSLAGKNWLSQAQQECRTADTVMVQLLDDEKKSEGLQKALVGTWSGQSEPEHKGKGINAVEKKKFSFGADGKLSMVEEMKGQSAEDLKEDWRYESWGTWQARGDTVLIHITREKCDQRAFWNLVDKNGKKEWVKNEKPPYDSTVTGTKKDRFMTFDFIKENLKKGK